MKHLISNTYCISLLLLVNGCNLWGTEPYYYAPISSHTIIKSSYLSQQWVKENVFISEDNLSPMMVASQGKVAFLGSLDRNDTTAIIVLKANSGDLQWQQQFGIPTTIFASPFALYVGRSGGASVTRYDLETGSMRWDTPLASARGSTYLTVLDDIVSVQTSASRDKFFILNANTGEIIKTIDGTANFLNSEGISFQRATITNQLNAINTSTQELLWSVKLDYAFHLAPIFTESEIFIRTDIGGIYCLERKTGTIKWHTENIAISNLAVAKGLVYFLTRDGKLQGLDLVSGEAKYLAQFDTDRFVLNGEEHIGGYHVAYDPATKMVFAELGDSAQLFAFQIVQR